MSTPEPAQDTETTRAIGLAAAAMAANLVAVVFTVIFTRLLGTALQVAAAREGTLGRLGRGGELAGTLARWTRHLLIGLLAITLAAILAREPLAPLLHVPRGGAAAGVPATAALWLLVCVQRGLLQAGRAYRVVGLSIVFEALGRLAV